MDTQEKWYSVKEFANSFGVVPGTNHPANVSEDTVYRWIKDGKLRAFEFPVAVGSGRRKHVRRLIAESERQRFIRVRMTA